MTGTADPHEPPPLPAFQHRIERTPGVYLTAGPERIYDDRAPGPAVDPPRVRGFAPSAQPDPLLWEGDQS